MEWSEVKDIIQSGRLELLHRSDQVMLQYSRHKQNCNVQDHVLHALQWSPTEINRLNRDRIAIFSDPSLYTVTKNDFPYDLQEDIHHLVIWSKIYIPLYSQKNEKRVEVAKHIDDFLARHLQKFNLKAGEDFCWFMNYTSLQSIRNISHIHLLVKSSKPEVIEKILTNF